MDELILPLTYRGEDLELPLKMYGYGHTFRVELIVGEVQVIFEPDEEGSFRALGELGKVEVGLLRVIAGELEKLR